MPSPSLLHDADWLIVDDEGAAEAVKMLDTYPDLGILALEGRGRNIRVLAPAAWAEWRPADGPTLPQLFNLLRQQVAQQAQS
jgi:hypothetical protein